jgi:hypothetical protein
VHKSRFYQEQRLRGAALAVAILVVHFVILTLIALSGLVLALLLTLLTLSGLLSLPGLTAVLALASLLSLPELSALLVLVLHVAHNEVPLLRKARSYCAFKI